MFDKQGRGFRHRTIKTSRKIEIYIIIIHITTAYLIETQKTTTNFLTVVKNCCARLTDGRYLHHPAGVSFRLLPCGRRSTRNRRSSLLRFEAYNNDIYFKFGRNHSSECPFSVPPLWTPSPRDSRRLLPTIGGAKRAAVNFSILRSYA